MAYLPLRRLILDEELSWVRGDVRTNSAFLDEYDSRSDAFGIFLGDDLVAAVRLVKADALRAMPSANFLDALQVRLFPGRIAEISRLLVQPRFRNRGVAALLIRRCVLAARNEGISNIFITVADNQRHNSFLEGVGFRVIKRGFSYRDSVIDPKEPAAIFQYDPLAHAYVLSAEQDLDILAAEVRRVGHRRPSEMLKTR
jgi:ribosomal protein S18 acetylase RimI-like enzyme